MFILCERLTILLSSHPKMTPHIATELLIDFNMEVSNPDGTKKYTQKHEEAMWRDYLAQIKANPQYYL